MKKLAKLGKNAVRSIAESEAMTVLSGSDLSLVAGGAAAAPECATYDPVTHVMTWHIGYPVPIIG